MDKVSVDRERMIRYLDRESERLGREARARVATREELLREFRFMLGLEPLPPRSPLKVTSVRTIEREEYTVEILHFQSLPRFYVTANLYRPKRGKAPFPAVVWGRAAPMTQTGAAPRW